MKKRSLMIGAVAFAALLALAACGGSGSEQAGQETTSASPTTTSAAAEAHNQADVTFAQHMIPHHQQAIEMSDVVLAKQGIDPRVVELANQIKAAQGPEIEQMQGWLTQWGQPTMPMMPGMEMPGQTGMPGMPGQTGMPGMPGQTGMPGMPDMESPGATPTTTPSQPSPTGMPGPQMPGMPDMPGMAGMMSPEDMAALQNAQGVEAGRLFLTQMIQHHQGAITMAQTEIDSGQSHPAVTLARSIIDTQQKEINTMQGVLATL
ncbi:DUF305 domain-containing protein [Mycolicibacterium rhodesiae]|jgi:uncharacterized protein (DUF305 family)|nr:DUF305 domain-containing protein [Mycolicibacterium rhodesiae]